MVALFSSIVLVLAAGVAPAAAPVADAGQLAAAPLCQTAPAAAVAPGTGTPLFLDSFCQADCTQGSDVSCSGNVCSAQNQVCSAGQQGHVTCDGQTTFCPSCPPTGGCTRFECRQGCGCPGCFSFCVDLETCTCECICQ